MLDIACSDERFGDLAGFPEVLTQHVVQIATADLQAYSRPRQSKAAKHRGPLQLCRVDGPPRQRQ